MIYPFGINSRSLSLHNVEVPTPPVFLLENSHFIPSESNRIDSEIRFNENILWRVKIVVKLKKNFQN